MVLRLRHHAFPQLVTAVRRPADDRQDGAPAPRRHSGGLEHLHGVLPGECCWPAISTRTRRRGGFGPAPGGSAHHAADGVVPRAADCRRSAAQRAADQGIPIGWLLRVLLVTVGIPFFLVSSSGPLLQRWFARTDHPRARDPYFLSVAGNIGSIFALLAYPALLEPSLRLAEQSSIWTGGYVALVLLTAACFYLAYRQSNARIARH